jgi:pyruvate dehydrogenase E2 component (dihydrolipoamide acetyltransferase)
MKDNAMPIQVRIPRLGWNMEEGTFMGWLKRDGDRVVAGEPLFSLEGDKSTQDIESLETGVLSIPPDAPKEGDKVLVGALIGYLLAPGEGGSPARPSAAADRPSGITQGHRDRAAAAENPQPRISPRARRVALELGVDTTSLQGTGATGRVRERDVRAAALAQKSPTGAQPAKQPGRDRRVPVSSVRRTIAERMLESVQSTAAVTLTTTVDATNLVNLRQQFKTVAGPGEAPAITVTDIIVKLTALALEDHPLLNARWDGDAIVFPVSIHIGIAVDTDAGLLVPVVRDVPRHGLRQLAAISRDLIEQARRGTLSAAELMGSTFTVSNLGALGIETFTPIINPPECAVLGIGRIVRQVVPHENQFAARDRIFLSLTFDHRVVDGAPAARFLRALGLLIENPSPWLLA